MTTYLERQFFKTFGIEPDQWCKIGIDKDGNFNKKPIDKRYPQITDRILLELICLIAKELNYFTNFSTNYEHLKEYILKEIILHKEDFSKSQVLELFKE